MKYHPPSPVPAVVASIVCVLIWAGPWLVHAAHPNVWIRLTFIGKVFQGMIVVSAVVSWTFYLRSRAVWRRRRDGEAPTPGVDDDGAWPPPPLR